MPWEITDDVEVYAERVWQLLAADPAGNTIALTVIETVRAGRRWSDEAMVFGWHDDGRVSGAVSMTPPYGLLLAVVPEGSVDELAAELHARAVFVPDVHGEAGIVDRFVAAWIANTSLRVATTMRLRLYALSALRAPTPSPAGRARRARSDDLAIAARWWTAFHGETGGPVIDPEPVVRNRIGNGLLWVWGTPPARSYHWLGATRPRRVSHEWPRSTHRRRTVGVDTALRSPPPAPATRFAAVRSRLSCSPTSITPPPTRSISESDTGRSATAQS